MAESPLKRQREDTQAEDLAEEAKRKKPSSSYNHILSLLDEAAEEEVEEEEEEKAEPAKDLSSLMTTLQRELSSDSSTFDAIPYPHTDSDQESSKPISKDDDDDKERVMRHLLEASDDELGIPSVEAGGVVDVDVNVNVDDVRGYDVGWINSVDDGVGLCDGLWDLEDEAANYYTLLQSELFM